MGTHRTLRDGLLSRIASAAAAPFIFDVAAKLVGVALSSDAGGSWFSWELDGSMASLLGTGVDSLVGFLVFGRELALVVSLRHEEEGAGETFVRGEEAGAGALGPAGDDFWKKETIVRCLVEAELEEAEAFVSFAGVRATEAGVSEAMMAVCRRAVVSSCRLDH